MPALINPFVEIGKLEGREEGELAMVERLVARKFPGLPLRALDLLGVLDGPRLLAFGEALLFFAREQECLDWLERA